MTTMDMNACALKDVEAEEARMNRYMDAAVAVLRNEAETPELAAQVIGELRASQKQWVDYAEGACGAVYTRWQNGTIRNLMALNCREQLTQERARTLWSGYIAGPADEETILPEPKALLSPR
jgi:uncharacterized protein YecT (DUF1311 family)